MMREKARQIGEIDIRPIERFAKVLGEYKHRPYSEDYKSNRLREVYWGIRKDGYEQQLLEEIEAGEFWIDRFNRAFKSSETNPDANSEDVEGPKDADDQEDELSPLDELGIKMRYYTRILGKMKREGWKERFSKRFEDGLELEAEKNKRHKHLIECAGRVAKEYTHEVIDRLADVFELDGRYKQDMPSVVVVDKKTYEEKSWRMGLDGWGAPFTYFPGSTPFFTPRGLAYFGHPEGPVISLAMPEVKIADLVEEGLHFLQWFYETRDLERRIRSPRFGLGFEGNENEEGLIVTEKIEGSPILRARFSSPGAEASFSNSVVHEAVAYFTRGLCGVNEEDSDYENIERRRDREIVGIPNDRNPHDLLEILTERGRGQCYSKILEWNGVENFDDFLRSHHFSGMVGNFPGELIHFLGYGLGAELLKDVVTDAQIRDFSRRVFRFNSNPNKGLEDLVELHQLINS